MSKYVIIGGSAGGIGAVEAIREVDKTGELTVISEEPFPQYSRPMISEYVSREATFEEMKYRSSQFWKNHKVQILTGKKAVKIDFKEKRVELDDGIKVDFEKLLIATGGRPVVPRIVEGEKDGVFTFTELSSAKELDSKLENSKKAVVIGGGLIGVSVTEALMKRGISVTVVELKDRILNLILDTEASRIAENQFRNAGVTIITGQTVTKLLDRKDDKSTVGGIELTDGTKIICDLVVVAIGIIPRTELVENTDVEVNRGILVNRSMQTTIPDVYACGDVAEAHDFMINAPRLLPLWPLAHLEGRIAGYNMAGKSTEYGGGTSMNALNYFDLPIISVGITDPEDSDNYEVLVDYRPEQNLYHKILLKNNKIAGFIFLGEIEKSGIFFHLLKTREDVSDIKDKLLSDTFGLVTLPETVRNKIARVN